ncbi:MAG: hypothetical protein JWQ98_1085 [Chlorobi bacterium]|nr:hypothetical protein [Chlorobiota bacterium]
MAFREHGITTPFRVLLGGIILASLGAAGCSQPKAGPGSVSGPPKIEIVGGNTVAWGKVPPGKLKKSIKVTNTGGDTLRITNVHPSCGCTTDSLDKKVLAPGDTATIHVQIDMVTRTGPQSKSLTVTSNDSTQKDLIISLTADIIRDVVAVPEMFPVINSAKAGREDTSAVLIKNLSNAPITVQPPEISNPGEMVVRFDMTSPKVLQPGDSMKIVAHVKPISSSVVSSEVTVNTTSTMVPVIKMNLTSNASPASPPPPSAPTGGTPAPGGTVPPAKPAAKSGKPGAK